MDFKGLLTKRFLILVLSNLILSYACFFVFWKNYSDIPVRQIQFSVLSSFFTIFGYFMTIYQISKLRDEKQMISDVQSELNFDRFKQDVHDSCLNTKNKLYNLIGQINSTTEFNDNNLQEFITVLDAEKNNMLIINVKYESYRHRFALPCVSCKDKIEECVSDFENIVDNRQLDSFNKAKHTGKIRKIISEIITMETQIRI